MSVRLTVEELIDEALLVIGGKVLGPPGIGPLVADRGGRQCAQGLAAGATCAVAGIDQDVVGQGEELVLQADIELLGALKAGVLSPGSLIEEVRAAEVSGEDEVSGDHVAGVIAEGAVGHQEHQMLWGVARGVPGLHADVAQGDHVTVLQPGGIEAVLPVLAPLAGDERFGTCRGRELTGAGEVVGVDMGLGDLSDAHAMVRGEVEVFADVAAGVDDHALAGGLAADEVAGLGKVLVVDAF